MATLTTAGVTFGDSTVQTTAYPGIPANNAIGSIQGFLCTNGTHLVTGSTVSGSNLFTVTSIGTAVTLQSDPGVHMPFGGNVDLNNTTPTGTKVNATTAFTLSSGTNAVTVSPTTGTWRLLTPNIKANYLGGCGATTLVSSVLAVRIS